MNTLSTKTLGHLMQLAMPMSKSHIRDLLMQSGLYDATSMDTADLVDRGTASPNKKETLRRPLLSAHDMAKRGNREAQDALLETVRLVAVQIADWYGNGAVAKLSGLREVLLGDGYELRVIATDPLADISTYVIGLLPLDPDQAPLNEEITALEAELARRGYDTAAGHYRLAVKHLAEEHHSSANGQLRSMLESLVTDLAVEHTGYQRSARAGQGGAAIRSLRDPQRRRPAVAGQPLPDGDGGNMLQGIWDVLHANGPHPGLSDADEARIRMQLVTALSRFLLKHFPHQR